jgi:hypothetical protein
MAYTYSIFPGPQAPEMQPCHPQGRQPLQAGEALPMLGGSVILMLNRKLGTAPHKMLDGITMTTCANNLTWHINKHNLMPDRFPFVLTTQAFLTGISQETTANLLMILTRLKMVGVTYHHALCLLHWSEDQSSKDHIRE